ncbi:MAG: hypothetical protein WAR83_04535 [Flavobacteriales bacterium]
MIFLNEQPIINTSFIASNEPTLSGFHNMDEALGQQRLADPSLNIDGSPIQQQ